MCYYQSPNRLRADSLPCEQPHSPGPGGTHFHQLGCPSVLCCVGAVNRIIPNYVIHMWMATGDDGLAATLHGPSTVSALAGPRVPVRVTTTTDYPFDESTLGLALGYPATADRAGPGVRLETDRRPSATRPARNRHNARNNPAGSLRLHQVPDFDVSRSGALTAASHSSRAARHTLPSLPHGQ